MSQEYVREKAKRVLSAELELADTKLEPDESDGARAPSYLLLPSGGRANRIVFSGTLTDVEKMENSEQWKARINDGTGNFLVYASNQYQPDAASTLRQIHENNEAPTFVTVVAKPDTYEPEDSDETIVTLRPESVTRVSRQTRNKLVSQAVEHTMERLQREEGEDVELAEEHHPDRREELKEPVISALENLQEATA